MNKIKIIALSESLYNELGKFSTNKGLSKVEEAQVLDGLVAVKRIQDMFKNMYIEEKMSTPEQSSETDQTPF